MEKKITLQSIIACPICGHRQGETMPTDACQYFYECSSCKTRFKPKQGDCCVYCSYGTVKCPPIQMGSSCCSQRQKVFSDQQVGIIVAEIETSDLTLYQLRFRIDVNNSTLVLTQLLKNFRGQLSADVFQIFQQRKPCSM